MMTRIPGMMKGLYEYSYFQAGTGRAGTCKRTLMDRIRLRRRRRKQDDLSGIRGWVA